MLHLGLPSFGEELRAVREDEWGTVDLPWHEGVLLMTVGCSWLHEPIVAKQPAQCAVLHRVALPPAGGTTRYSLPFLVDLVDAEPQPAAQ